MYVNIIIYSNKLLFVWSTLNKEKKKKISIENYFLTCTNLLKSLRIWEFYLKNDNNVMQSVSK